MTTGGLVAVLDPDPARQQQAIHLIGHCDRFQIGEQIGLRLALVLQTEHTWQSKGWLEWLETLPGVRAVEVAFVHDEGTADREPLTEALA